MDAPTESELGRHLPQLIATVGQLARHCDRAEHNEQTSQQLLIDLSADLRRMATLLLGSQEAAVRTYADRLEEMELRHLLGGTGLFDGGAAVRNAKTWLDLQRAQMQHDLIYHGDVVGMPKWEQLRHYTLHLAKLAWLLQEASSGTAEDRTRFLQTRAPDLMAFGIKIATVAGSNLPEETL